MARPSFQFYPDDWLTDLGLRRSSIAARGAWMDLMCLMHQGTPYGYLTDKTGPLPVRFVAQICSISVKKLAEILHELESNGVFSRDENGTIFSRRMMRDEAVRVARSTGGSKSLENPNVPRPRPKDIHEDTLKGYPPTHPSRMVQLCASHAEDEDEDIVVEASSVDTASTAPSTKNDAFLREIGWSGGWKFVRHASAEQVSQILALNESQIEQSDSPDSLLMIWARLNWFEEFWDAYWRKVDKKAARIKFFDAVTSLELHERVMQAVEEQTPEMMAREETKRPHAATWLNHERWNDVPVLPGVGRD